jgi:ATP-dependent DNA helicase RecQ
VLLGNRNEKTTRFGHADMPVFGAGKDIPSKTWQSVYRQLLAAGFVSVDHEAFGALKLEEGARTVFKREREVRFRKDRPTTGKASRSASPSAANARSALEGSDAELFEALRVARLGIAKELSVPPYVVFPDTTLVAFATARPTSRDALLGISGVGQSKLERYGDAFLAVIRTHER